MICDPHEDFLTIIRSYNPDPKKPLAVVRREFSAFYEEFQEIAGEPPELERVEISPGVIGYWISVRESVTDRVVLFFHSGGFTLGSTQDHLGFCTRIARAARARVFSVDYRLAPEHPFPAPVADAIEAYTHLLAHGYLPHRILPAGLSSGGTLVLDLLLSARDKSLRLPQAGICLSPATDMLFCGESVTKNRDLDWVTAARLDSMRTVYLTGHDPHDPLASPMYARLNGLPKLYIQAGSHELMFDGIGSFVDKARWAGVPVQFEVWEGMFHNWQLFANQIPEAREAIDRIGVFARDVLSR
jgi:acetyl esterase/lipase